MNKSETNLKMIENECRLCFEAKPALIGIFAEDGIELKIAEIIRKHFPDEVNYGASMH